MDTKEIKKYKDALKKMSETEQPAMPRKNVDTRAIIAAMRADIKEMIANGYSYEQVLKALNNEGMSIKETTLKSYLFKKEKETERHVEQQKDTKKKQTSKSEKQKTETKPILITNGKTGKDRTRFDTLTDD